MIAPIILEPVIRGVRKAWNFIYRKIDVWVLVISFMVASLLVLVTCSIVSEFQADDKKCQSKYGRNWDHQNALQPDGSYKLVCVNVLTGKEKAVPK